MKTLQVTIRNNYGNEQIYPTCEHGQLLCRLANTKTFTDQAIAICKQLGYTFEAVVSKGRTP